jgi:3'-phosphoadenosine 5'-phosphosulfate sulfotransferase (PAPS reductase)/FAD synthetase
MIHRVRIAPESLSAKRALGQTEKSSIFALPKKWLYLVDEPYETSPLCCNKLKKEPALKFQKQTGRYPILGIMASESQLREKTYIRNGGCNTFDSPKAKSHPLSIWMPEDIDAYIERYHIPIADIYETGIRSSGCVGCGFGAQFKDDMRFEALYRLQPKYYEMVMNYTNNGVTFREALRKVLATNGLHLPDEEPKELF